MSFGVNRFYGNNRPSLKFPFRFADRAVAITAISLRGAILNLSTEIALVSKGGINTR